MPSLLVVFALIALVLIVSTLATGIVERTPISFPMIFLGIGFLAGQGGLGIIAIGPHSPALQVVTILSLSFVLFLDAANLRFGEIGDGWIVPALSLGPGTLLTAAFISIAAAVVLKFALLPALLLGAILSSIDPVVLRDVVRDERIPRSVRRALLSSVVGAALSLATLIFAVLVIAAARPLTISLVLSRATISRHARVYLGWFGPRGLSSLLFALLVIQAGVSGAQRLLPIVGIVVIVSVVAHGVSASPLSAWYGRAIATKTMAEEREGTAAGLFHREPAEVPRITPHELADRLAGLEPPMILDVRSRSSYEIDQAQIPGSVRVPPDQVIEWARDRPRDRSVVTYCT